MSPARAQTRTAWSGVELTNREATAPPKLTCVIKVKIWLIVLKLIFGSEVYVFPFQIQINQSGHERELSLDVDQFCEILSIVLNKGTREEYEDLFNKVDVGKEGYVDWDKFCSHMLLEYYEKDDRMKTTQVWLQAYPLVLWNAHR